ncbi:hypothetical protein EC968_003272 [Mortierella alpina]|nr:hypothetical protein EC968_003272 [Mortierella alpina]
MNGNAMKCLTTDSGGTTFYGMIFAHDYAISKYPSRQTDIVAVVKSNTSPASPLSMTWSLVSKIGLESLTGKVFRPSRKSLCAINSKGVFSILMHFGTELPGSTLPSPSGPRLFQYDPRGKTMDASFNYKGVGSWSNVTIEAHDSITGRWFEPRMQYAYNGQVETLIFSVIGLGFDVHLAVLNEATNTLAHAATWKMNTTLYGTLRSDAIISGDRLYLISEGERFPHHPLPYVASFPISAQIPANTPEGRMIEASVFGEITRLDPALRLDLATNAGTLYVLARKWFVDNESFFLSQTHNADEAATLGSAISIPQKIDDYLDFVPLGGEFALVTRDDQLDAISLSGPSLGNLYSNISINIIDSVDPNSEYEVVQSSGESKVGLIVGVAIAVLVLVGAGIGYFFWKKRRATGTAGAASAIPALPPKDLAYTQGHDFVQKIESLTVGDPSDRPITYDHTAGFIGATVAPPTTATTMMSGTQVQYFQDHMQGLQLSSHPRPNVVTTGGTANLG